jgi:hypothetical protein
MFTRNESQWAMIPYKVFDLLISRGRSQVNFNRVERISPLMLRNRVVCFRTEQFRRTAKAKDLAAVCSSAPAMLTRS